MLDPLERASRIPGHREESYLQLVIIGVNRILTGVNCA
jgi:hypothetical protein